MSNPGQRPGHEVPVETARPDGLAERMQGGDLEAFEEFFNTYKRPVYATALAITRDPFLAEEVLQDCFVKAYRVRERLQPERSPLPWLQRVAINLCYSRVSRRRALAEPITSIISNLVVDLQQRPDQIVESREILDVLQRGIDALPPKQQTAIILYYLHGYSLSEASEIADCNVGTMKSRLHFALDERVATAAPSADAWSGILARAQVPESRWRRWLRSQSMLLAGRLRTATAVSAMALALVIAAGTDVAIEVSDGSPGAPSASDLLAEQYERGPTRLVPAGIGIEEAAEDARASSGTRTVGQPEFGVSPGGRVSRPVVEELAPEEPAEELVGPAFVIRPRPSGLWSDELQANDAESGSSATQGVEAPAPRPPL